jgi:polysaccharide biosynthesis/export protein
MKSLQTWWSSGACRAVVLLALAGLGACGSLPDDGPSSRSVPREASQKIPAGPVEDGGRYALVDLTFVVSQTIAAHPPEPLAGLAGYSSTEPTNLIREGDQLSVAVFEPGGNGLFSSAVGQSAQGGTPAPSVSDSKSAAPTPEKEGGGGGGGTSAESLALVVSDDGFLQLPFAGNLYVAGLTPMQASLVIQRKLNGRAIDPQVTVAVVSSPGNSVSVLGEVQKPGRFQLAVHNDRLLDVLAQAGGPAKPIPDLAIGIYRADKYAEIPLPLLINDPAQNIRLAPADRLLVLDRPRTYSTFGALLQNNSQPMLDNPVTLADAISKGGGLDTNSANNSMVLLFRFERQEVANALGVTLPAAAKGIPIVYRVNLRRSEDLFVANTLYVQPGDMIYVARSDAAEAKKFFDLVNSVTQIGYNARVVTSGATP